MSAATLRLGPIGRLGRYAATHTRRVAVAWVVIAVGLGALAPRVETALSGAGWESTGSDSVAARSLVQREFAGDASSGPAMIFAIAMDYTVFLLASAKEHHEHSGGDAREAMIGGVAHSGRVILAAAAVMVAVFLTFALSGPLPPKEMGIILGVAVALDAFLVRLLLVPVALRLLGPAAWWLPRGLQRLLPAVSFGHGHS